MGAPQYFSIIANKNPRDLAGLLFIFNYGD